MAYYYDKKYETMEVGELKSLQGFRLKRMVRYLNDNSPFYKDKLEGIEVGSIEDIAKLPFTEKDDLRDNYPLGLLAIDLKKVREIHVSSGTTGNPTVVGYSRSDLMLWGDAMARSIACAGGLPGDMIQISYGYGLFTGGLGAHYGALKLGLTIIPMSSGQTKRQIKIMRDFKPRILACTPSYAMYLAEEAKRQGLSPEDISWEVGIFGAEPWSDNMRKALEEALGLKATDVYGLSEIIGPGVAQECHHCQGLHVWSDLFYPEIINPDTLKPAKEGETGELVITTLTKSALPLIRYRTRDIVALEHGTCKCGRTMPRMTKVKGRTDDMIVVRGINLFPSQVEHVLLNVKGVSSHYQIIVDRSENYLDSLEVMVELADDFVADKISDLVNLEKEIVNEISSVLNLTAKIKLVSPLSIPRTEGKAKRIVDKRNL